MKKHYLKINGQTLTEYALTITISLMFLFMTFDFGRAIFTYSVLSNAAREGARFASVKFSDTNRDDLIDTYIQTRIPGIDPIPVLTTNIDWHLQNTKEISVTLSLSYPFDPLIGEIIGINPITLGARSSMMLEY